MKRLLLGSLVVASLLCEKPAAAANWYWDEAAGTKATYVHRHIGCYSGSTTFETDGLTKYADTVLHVTNSSDVEIGYNDDYGASPRSRVTVTLPAGACTPVTVTCPPF